MKRIFGFILIILFVIETWLAIYGGVQLCTRAGKLELVRAQNRQINMLELKVKDYERTIPILPVLRQLLTEMNWLELEALAEGIKQRKAKGKP